MQLIEADGNSTPFNAGDVWSGARTLNDASTPNSRLVGGASSGVSISNFSACGATMTADITAPGTPVVATSDAFGAAAGVATLPYQQTGATTASATVEAGEPTPSCGTIGKTVWFRYTPAASGTLIADTIGSGFDTLLAVYRGSTLGGLTQVGCNDDIDNAASNLASKAQFAVTGGQTYYVQVGGFKGQSGVPASGALTFHLTEVLVPPANDAFAAAAGVATLPFSRAALDTRAATTEAGEPTPTCAPAAGKSAWFRYAPTGERARSAPTRPVRISTPCWPHTAARVSTG